MKPLNLLRQDIDQIDEQILKLFIERMDIAGQVAQYKIENDMPVFNNKREQEILCYAEQNGGKYAKSARFIFQMLMDVSRAHQYTLMDSSKDLRRLIENCSDEDISNYSGTVTCQGVAGAYSEIAARQLFSKSDIHFVEKFEDVFLSVSNGETDFGVVPVENSLAGSVYEIYDLLTKYNLYITAEQIIGINHCLAAPDGANISNIKKVYSHPQALNQCSNFINKNGYDSISCLNTADAAKNIAKNGDCTCAAICSQEAAENYGLKVLVSGIQNLTANQTRFIVISKRLIINSSANKISLSFSLPHHAGSLVAALSRFTVHGLNLTKIESRPMRSGQFEYLFYVDFTGNVFENDIISLLCSINEDYPQFSFLGNFKGSAFN